MSRSKPPKRRQAITSVASVLKQLQDIANHRQEHFIVFTLNAHKQINSRHIVFKGTVDGVSIHPREIYALALEDRAVSILVAHNHPSGNPEPSRHDTAVTQQLVFASQLMNIKLLDHVIIAGKEHFSYQENMMIVPKDGEYESFDLASRLGVAPD